MFDVLAGQADIVGDLVDLIALLGPGRGFGSRAARGWSASSGSISQSHFLTWAPAQTDRIKNLMASLPGTYKSD
jgi:hypothetical protein